MFCVFLLFIYCALSVGLFILYILLHNGDFKEATKDLYEQGFGSRRKKEIEKDKPKIDKPLPISGINFPLDIFPEEIQHYILECNKKLDANIDYMGCSLLWLISVCVGNTYEIEVKKGWTEPGVIWLAVVGRAGIGKTPSIDNIIKPLNVLNFKEIKRYSDQMEVYNYYNDLTKKEKEEHPEPMKPKKTQFIANDITLEALVDLHQESDNAVGVFKDELAGWFKDMNIQEHLQLKDTLNIMLLAFNNQVHLPQI